MELQLGLALSLPAHNIDRGFNLNNIHGVEKKEMILGVETWSYGCSKLESENHGRNKRSSEVAFEKSAAGNESKMLRLMLWNGQPNEEDDEKGQKRRETSITKNDDGGNHVVGWPPIKSWRKKMLYQHHGYEHDPHPLQNHRLAYKENENDGSANSLYVKVKMEGVGIVRKIDIRLHHCYQTLKDTLITMFSKYEEGGVGADYILTYQDKQGDWLLAADVPWQTFIESVQRLQILRNGG